MDRRLLAGAQLYQLLISRSPSNIQLFTLCNERGLETCKYKNTVTALYPTKFASFIV